MMKEEAMELLLVEERLNVKLYYKQHSCRARQNVCFCFVSRSVWQLPD